MPTGVAGRVALVTGAGQGVGRQTALTFAAHGARAVVVNDVDAERAGRVAAAVRALGVAAVAAPADVGDPDAVAGLFDHVAAEVGPVQILVNNAGIRAHRSPAGTVLPLWEQPIGDWESLIRVNLLGVIHCTRNALLHMMPGSYGRIVTIVSDGGRVGEANGMEVYSATKAGAAGFTRAVARLGGRFGVTANCVSLGATRTPGTEDELDDPELAARALSRYIVRRFGEPADAAAAVLYLCSASASWVTGQTLPVNGGYSLAL
ncbi:SDR family NAD(P)-dependent oxidoreductase [Mycolicibacterium sp.]|uniref:SDR family NAD(P)-dependent oxidoreductase n=1 Tax=Mycolicibacterium sp. TaxID=2320850 RepID=UPI003D11F67F